MTDQRRTITVEFPVDVQEGNAGLFYVTSPLVTGFLVSGRTEEEALGDTPKILADLTEARREPPFRQACRTYSGPDPQDCNWPFCGCDDRANKVLETLEECGYAAPDEARRLRDENENLAAAARMADRRNDELREALKDWLAAVSPDVAMAVRQKTEALLNPESEP